MKPLARKERDLRNAPLSELLLYGLALDPEDDPEDAPVLGIVLGVQQELKLIATLLISTPPVGELAESELCSTLELLSRRLEVACEQMRRAKQASNAATLPEADAADKADSPGER